MKSMFLELAVWPGCERRFTVGIHTAGIEEKLSSENAVQPEALTNDPHTVRDSFDNPAEYAR